MVGSGFNAKFHMLGFVGVRDADVLGVWSPNAQNAAATAGVAKKLGVGDAKPYPSIAAMVEDPAIDAIWLSGPNHAASRTSRKFANQRGKGTLKGVACEKPLARNVKEAQRVLDLVNKVGLPHGYLENQLFSPQVEVGRNLLWARGAKLTGRPYLARAAEEHSGPHAPWFWQGKLQGGGVLNDMMCHSSLLVQHLLTDPTKPRTSVKPSRVTAHIASLKWSRPEYVKKLSATMGKDVNYDKSPSEDFAAVMIEFETDDGLKVLGEATTSWSFVGAGLRLSAELLGPEYSMAWNSLDSGLKLFFSREVQGKAGEDLVEKQNAEIGQMPVVANEASAYGYEAEDRHFVNVFLGESSALTFDDGLQVVKVLIHERRAGKTLDFPPKDIETFIPAVAKGPGNHDRDASFIARHRDSSGRNTRWIARNRPSWIPVRAASVAPPKAPSCCSTART
jgi:predicted dehydrogenase